MTSIAMAVLALFWVIFLTAFSLQVFSFLLRHQPGLIGTLGWGSLLAPVLVAVMAFGLLAAVTGAFFRLFAASDLPLLFALPLSPGQVFSVKFVEIILPILTPVLLLQIPVSVGLGLAVSAPPWYWPALLGVSGVMVVMPAALGSLLNLIVVRVLPAYRAREMGVVLGSTVGALIFAGIHLLPRWLEIESGEGLAAGAAQLGGYLPGWDPLSRLAAATEAAAQGDFGSYLVQGGPAAAFTLILAIGAFGVTQRAFMAGWTQGRPAGKKAYLPGSKSRAQRIDQFLVSHPVAALAGKEIHALTRDWQEWAQALYLLVILGVSFGATWWGDSLSFPGNAEVRLYVVLGLTFMVLSFLALSLAPGALAREGAARAFLWSAPLKGWDVLVGKIAGVSAVVGTVGIVTSLIMGLLLRLEAIQLLLLVVFVVAVAPATVSINVVLGALQPNFAADDPQNRVPGWVIVAALAINFGLALGLGLAVFLAAAGSWVGWGLLARVLGLALILGLLTTTMLLPPWVMGRRLDLWEM